MSAVPKALEFDPLDQPSDKLGWALLHARSGHRVLPVRPNSKIAAIKDWPNEATTDEAKIRN